jgi:membrane-associated phospholipid phosphatase
MSMDTRKSSLLHLGSIFVFLLISGMVFASLAEDVVNRESFSSLDPIFGNWLITRTSLAGDRIFSIVTFWGNSLVISVGTGLLGLWFARRKRRNQLIFLFSTVGGAALLNLILKHIFLRPRPIFPQAFLVVSGFSFPSGHAMISLAFYGAIAYLAFSMLKRRRSKLLAAGGALVVSALIGFSRLYLGVHYLSDVLAGWAAGGLWLAVCILGDQLHLFSKLKGNQEN